jgi:DNA-binding response OmpR family regulator
MKKILIDLKICNVLLEKKSFLSRDEVQLFTAASNDEALAILGVERIDLIIADLDAPGTSTEQFCSMIRKDPALQHVAIIMVCACDSAQMSRSRRYGVDAIILRPIKPSFLLEKARQLLHLSWRETYRVLMDVSVDGTASEETFSCRSLDISSQGILVETTRIFALGERLVCTFMLPDAAHIRAKGVVARNLPTDRGSHVNRYGIHFQDLTPGESKAIEEFLDSAAQKKRSGMY